MASKPSAPLFVPRSVMASESAAVRIAGRASSIASVTPLERSFSVIGRMARFANRVADGWLGSSSEPRPSGRAQVGAEVGLVVPRPWYLEPKPQAAAVPRRRPIASTVESSEVETSTALETVADSAETTAPSTSMSTRIPELPRDLVAAPIAPVGRAEEILELRVRDVVPRPALPTVARRPEQIASPLQAALRHAAWVDTQITQRVQAAATAVTTVTQRAAERAATVEQAFSYVTPVVPAARPTPSRPSSQASSSERFADAFAASANVEAVAAGETSSPSIARSEVRPPSTPVAPPPVAPSFSTPVAPAAARQVAPLPASAAREVRPTPVVMRDGRVDVAGVAPIAPSLGFVAAMPAAFTPAPTAVEERVQTIGRFIDRLVAPQLAAIATPRTVVLSSDGRAMAVQREVQRDAPELSPIILSSRPAPAARGAAPRREGGVEGGAVIVSAGAPDPVFTPVATSTAGPSDVIVESGSVTTSPRSAVVSSTADVVAPSIGAPSTVTPASTSWLSVPATELVAPLPVVRPSLARPGAVGARAEEVAIGQALRVARIWGESLTVVNPTTLSSSAAVMTGAATPTSAASSERVATPRAFSTGDGADRPVVSVAPPARPGGVVVGASASRSVDRAASFESSSSEGGDLVAPVASPPAAVSERRVAMPVASATVGAAPPTTTTMFSTTTAGGIAATGGFISRLLGVQLVQQMAPLPLVAQPTPSPVVSAAFATTSSVPTLVGAAARAPLADELVPPPAPVAAPVGRRDVVRASRGAEAGRTSSVEAQSATGRREPVADDAFAPSGAPLVAATTEGLTMLRPGGVGLVAEQLAGRVGVRASSLAIEFVDPPALGQVVSVSRAAELRDTTQVVGAPSAPSPRALAAGGVSSEPGVAVADGAPSDESMPFAAVTPQSPAGGGSFVAAGALPSSAPGVAALSPSPASASASASFARLTRKANTLSADEWALVSVFPSETTAYQVAAARQARSWQRLESRGVDAVFVPSIGESASQLSFAVGAASISTFGDAGGERSGSGSARTASPFALSSGAAGEEGSPYVVSWTRGQVPSVVAAADQPRLPDGRLPRGGALWPSSASFEPVFELTLPSLTSNAQKVAEAPVGQPLWNVLPSSPIVEGVAWRPTPAVSEPVEETPQLVTGSALRPGTPPELTGPAARVPSVPVVKTVAPTGSRGARPTVKPLSRAEREDGDVRPAPGSPDARPALAIIKGGAAGSVAARGSYAGGGGGGAASGGSSGSPSSSGSGGDTGVGVDGQGGVSFRPSSEAAAKLLEAVRSPGAIPQDGRVTMADLTLIAIASTTQQVAAAEEGGGPAAAPAGGDGGGGGGAAGGGKAGGGGGGADITAIAEKVYEAYKRLLEVQRERSGDSWES